MKRRILYIALTILTLRCALAVRAEETVLVGEVLSELTSEPIEGVNVHFRGTKVGTTTDETGTFVLRVDLRQKMQLVVSAVGYHSQKYEVEPGTMAGVQVILKEKISMLEEVLAIPGVNPAIEFMRRVREARANNDRAVLGLQQELKSNRELYVSHIRRRHLQKPFWQTMKGGLILQKDSTYLLPLYRETQTFKTDGAQLIPANDLQQQALIMSQTDYSALLSLHGNLNFYATTVSLMDHPFISPIAANATTYYKFYLADSVQTEEGKQYIIHFLTKNPYYATFNGSLTVDSVSYAIHELEAEVPAQANVNYLSNVRIYQRFSADHHLEEENISALLDFAVKTDTAHIFPTVLIRQTMSSGRNVQLAVANTDTIVSRGSVVENAMDSLSQTPLIRTATWIARIALTGYIPTGTCVDIGHVQEILQVNDHEGVHVGLPFRTNEKLFKNVSLEAAIGYGWKDRRLKGLGRISWQLPTLRRNILRLEYQDRYVWTEVDDFQKLMRENSAGLRWMDFTSYAFEALHRDSNWYNTAMRQRQAQLYWESDWSDVLETHAYLRLGWQDEYRYESLSVIARLGWGEKKYDGYFRRRYGYSAKYPVLYLGAEVGSYTWEQSSYQLYAHLRVMLTQRSSLGMGGTLQYALQAGWIFGQVPQPMLWQAQGNQGYGYDPYRFTMMHNGEMLADRYLAMQAEWNGQGVLFNLIPGVRYLHLRELVETKWAYGYLSDRQTATGVVAQSISGHQWYGELGVGIGNILRVCDLYSVWRLSPNSMAPNPRWAIRFRIHLGL